MQEMLASVQNELCMLQAVAEARDWWYAMRVTCVKRVCDARDARSNVVASRSAAGARWRARTDIPSDTQILLYQMPLKYALRSFDQNSPRLSRK